MQAFMRPVMAGYHHHHQQQLLLQQQQQQQQQQEHQQQLQLQLQQEQQQLQEQQHLQEQQAFDQEMASHSEYDQIASTQGYEWAQETSSPTLGSNQLASALSLDMLLSLGSTSDPSSSTSLSSEEYSISSSSPNEASSALVLSTQQPSMPNASHLPQQTYYELLMAANPNEPLSQLLSTSAASMTSTCFTATAASSIPTTVASSSSASTLPLDSYDSITTVSSSAISTATAGSMAIVDSPTTEQILTSVASAYSMSAFPLGPSSMEQQQQEHQQQQQQTVPLTTKEIMDALSGQFPIQPVMTSTVMEVSPPTVTSVILSDSAATVVATTSTTSLLTEASDDSNSTDDSTEARVSSQGDKDSSAVHEPVVLSNAPTTIVESRTILEWNSVAAAPVTALLSEEPVVSSTPVTSISIRHEQQQRQMQQQDESWDSDADVLSPPSLVYAHDTDDEGSSSAAILSSDASPPAQVDLEMSEMTLTSPPLSPSRPSRMLKRSKSLAAGGLTGQQSADGTSPLSTSQRRKSRRISRRYQAASESSSFSARWDMSVESNALESDEQQDEQQQQQDIQQQQQQQVATMPPKRRRPSDDDTSESPCSSPESSPPSPRTPPPSSALPSLVEDLHHHHHLIHNGAHATADQEMDPSKRFKVEEVQAGVEAGEDAGVLSPLLLTRSPKRQSSRLLRRTSGRAVQSTHHVAPAGVVCAADSAHSSLPGHGHTSGPNHGKVSAA
ncbi:hypothetical protein BGZ95_011286 [Linnemannia exigua]|uniref:Uncharacterized protein n=1 Tax=Linnemannia exigua TaxID=604196 RepID=A0AAD4DA88_9FUNG|nr:hypothetical protein BGZ95_011286 [Linnemannia exigua]